MAQRTSLLNTPNGSQRLNTGDGAIGNRSASDRGIAGDLDNVRIYDPTLTPEHIAIIAVLRIR